ncbi:DNA alkylation repair protein [Tuwongella immobilis]|uniref:DNA alkylation repair protein n=1 Tax=Tuwongella immobilis TaxID=692036 RepID=A0A6C2YNU6_9BACT|nr:DNA alkylation repair protein [Tuwongella immobilis]VIP02803.1 dna alkylation repair protein : DNA alkylation repair protein OS=Cupriavidus sp. SK-3 GN=CF70_015665 PE=4 SV=1: DNA_alkylation [Tuwongella immobilis]VTS02497.1 dna alkylation repair protein : DNA alkylation repair protein OS=Cupriavidus sp. SK-3 GN=CF70_015665 PE=4 SV=1: DNA_alkylation [Tuwongella immobilis]
MAERRGASSPKNVPAEIRAQLEAGTLETATLAESLAVNLFTLLRNVAEDAPIDDWEREFGDQKIVGRTSGIGRRLAEQFGESAITRFGKHSSDLVRGWVPFVIAAIPGWSLEQRLMHLQPLADDPHFGVREWAWMAMRPHLAEDLPTAIRLLTSWTAHPSANVRRFAVEATRPRGVWCAHLTALKDDPEPGRVLLDPLYADPTKYVQDSVANWLNDAAKSAPNWVRALTADWLTRSDAPATARIVKRALRSLD